MWWWQENIIAKKKLRFYIITDTKKPGIDRTVKSSGGIGTNEHIKIIESRDNYLETSPVVEEEQRKALALVASMLRTVCNAYRVRWLSYTPQYSSRWECKWSTLPEVTDVRYCSWRRGATGVDIELLRKLGSELDDSFTVWKMMISVNHQFGENTKAENY